MSDELDNDLLELPEIRDDTWLFGKESRKLLDDAKADGKKAKIADVLTPLIRDTVAFLANAGQKVIYTDERWWLYEQSLGYWKRTQRTYIEQVFDRVFRQLAGYAPTAAFAKEIVEGLKRQVNLREVPWANRTANQILCKNGVLVDLETGQTRAPRDSDWLREVDVIPHVWDTTATCPVWDQTINQLLQHVNAAERAQTQALIEEWMGSTLFRYGRSRAISRCMMFWSNKPHTGKSTVLDVLRIIWGPDRCTDASLKEVGRTFGLQGFLGKTVWLCDETPEGRDQLDAEVFKRLITNEPLSVNVKHEAAINGRMNITVGIASNSLPYLGENPEAMHARIIFVGFDTQIKEDPLLKDKLAVAAPGILQKIWRNGMTLKTRGYFDVPKWVMDKQAEIREEQDPLADFCAQAFDTSPAMASTTVRVSDVITAYKGYRAMSAGRDEADARKVNGVWVARRLSELLPTSGRTRVDGGTTRVRTGVGFNTTGTRWLDAGLKVEDSSYQTSPVRLKEANGTIGAVVAFPK